MARRIERIGAVLEVILDERSTDDDEPIDPDDAPPNRFTRHRDPGGRWGAQGKDNYSTASSGPCAEVLPRR